MRLPPPEHLRNPMVTFTEKSGSNDTHESTTDPECGWRERVLGHDEVTLTLRKRVLIENRNDWW